LKKDLALSNEIGQPLVFIGFVPAWYFWYVVVPTAQAALEDLAAEYVTASLWNWEILTEDLFGNLSIKFYTTIMPDDGVLVEVTQYTAVVAETSFLLEDVQAPGLDTAPLYPWPANHRDTFIVSHPDAFPAGTGGWVHSAGAGDTLIYTRVENGIPMYQLTMVASNWNNRATVTILEGGAFSNMCAPAMERTLRIPLVARVTGTGDVRARIDRGTSQVSSGSVLIAGRRSPVNVSLGHVVVSPLQIDIGNLVLREPYPSSIPGYRMWEFELRAPSGYAWSLRDDMQVDIASTLAWASGALLGARAVGTPASDTVSGITVEYLIEGGTERRDTLVIRVPAGVIRCSNIGLGGVMTLSNLRLIPEDDNAFQDGRRLYVQVANTERNVLVEGDVFIGTASHFRIISPSSWTVIEGVGGSFNLETAGWTPPDTETTFRSLISAPAGVSIVSNQLRVADTVAAGTYNFIIEAIGGSLIYTQNFTLNVTASAPNPVTSITVVTQPTNLIYTAGQTLDLSGLVVRLTFQDGSTMNMPFANFGTVLTASPAHGTALTVAAHHNNPVTVTYTTGGHTATTNNLTVTTAPPGDATLASLTVSHGTLSPVFNPNVFSYTVNVGNAVSAISVNAVPVQGATVSGAGVRNLSVGRNTITLVVTAAAGNTQTYTVVVYRDVGQNVGGGTGSGGWGVPVAQRPRPAVTAPVQAPDSQVVPQIADNQTRIPLPFIDVATGAWYYSVVRTVWENDLFQGTAHNLFSPDVPMTRAMFVQVLANLEDVNLDNYRTLTPTFGDVSQSAWYFAAVEWAVRQNIVQGIGEGNFAPDMPVTREQMAVMLNYYANSRTILLPVLEVGAFTDQADVSPWAVEAVESIQAAGIITGRPDGRFDPLTSDTRAEVAAIFARFLSIIVI